jgi:hypothetical protein
MNDAAGFYRIWRMPRRCWRGADLWHMTPRGQYLYDRSRKRFARRPDAYLTSLEPLRGEIGTIESFRFISSVPLEEDPVYCVLVHPV